jgi:hypothetical protein
MPHHTKRSLARYVPGQINGKTAEFPLMVGTKMGDAPSAISCDAMLPSATESDLIFAAKTERGRLNGVSVSGHSRREAAFQRNDAPCAIFA